MKRSDNLVLNCSKSDYVMNKMKNILKIIIILLIFCNNSFAQSVTWQRYYDVNNSSDAGLDVLQTFDGGYAICGYGGGSLLLMKINYLGFPEWQRVIPDSNVGYRANSFQQTNDSGFIITGDVRNDSLLLLKADKSGYVEWKKTFTNPSGQSRGYSIRITNDNGYIISGDIFYFSILGIKAYVLKTDSVGNLQWSKEYDSLSSYDIIQTLDNNYYFVGGTSIKKINSIGNLIWVKRLGTSIIGASFFNVGDILQDSSNALYISGGIAINGGNTFNMYLGKTDTSGTIIWENYYYPNSSCSDFSKTIIGDIVMVGSALSDSINPTVNVAIVKINKYGNEIFSKRINSTTNIDGDGNAIKLTSDNGYIITGGTEYGGSSSRTNVLGIKTDSLGNTTTILDIKLNTPISLKNFILEQNYPNPFNPLTTIKYTLKKMSDVKLFFYDILGNEINKIILINQNSGSFSYEFNGINLSTGIYFYRFETDNFTETKKMLLIK